MEWSLASMVLIGILAFGCEFIDSTLGMGYGTALTPILMLMGFSPAQVVPAVLFSELFTGLTAGVLHHRQGNVDFRPKSTNPSVIMRKLSSLGYVESFRQGIPLHLKVALLLGICSIVGTVAAVFVAVSIPKFWLKLYIGVLVLLMGIVILVLYKREFRFSWKKITVLGVIASFNKGMSGGGYGPVVTVGQVLSGVKGANAVAITSLAEGLTCFVGVVLYYLLQEQGMNWRLALTISLGALASVPLSVFAVKRIHAQALKLAIAVVTIVLGSWTLYNLFCK
ncbi:MAG: sulfite exporter TauE/SafE family protein [Sedimentisphaerales bacterium]|nr:sulfite exporter TauE/SafE family protein [Sedimentisphaerales bacterium]